MASQKSELMGDGKFEVVRGSWSRWYKGKRVLHDSDNMTRAVQNVTVDEYRTREDQLLSSSSSDDLAEMFQPNRVSHGTAAEAKAEIKRAGENDVQALHLLLALELSDTVRDSIKTRCAKLGSPVSDSA